MYKMYEDINTNSTSISCIKLKFEWIKRSNFVLNTTVTFLLKTLTTDKIFLSAVFVFENETYFDNESH